MDLGHKSVLTSEVLAFLNINKGGRYIDATVGAGGHGIGILDRGGILLGIDWDREALELAKWKIEDRGWRVDEDFVLVHDNFGNIDKIARERGFVPARGVLFDLGISSMQIDKGERGFSFQRDEILDMRMNPDQQGVTARDLLNALGEQQLYELFSQTTRKNVARAVSRAIVRARYLRKIDRTSELTNLVNGVYKGRKRTIVPATTIFLALRLAVNSELENLESGLSKALEVLGQGGRLVVISFHSGEDRIVKTFFAKQEKYGRANILTKRPAVPTLEEIATNPRSRSAKLRVITKL